MFLIVLFIRQKKEKIPHQLCIIPCSYINDWAVLQATGAGHVESRQQFSMFQEILPQVIVTVLREGSNKQY